MKFYVSTNWNGKPAEQTTDCFDAMSSHVTKAFDRLGVSYEVCPIGPPRPDALTLYIGYVQHVRKHLVNKPKSAKTAWLCETNFCKEVDHSFHFVVYSTAPNQTRIKGPWEPSLYRLEPKDNVILIDHSSWHHDHTQEIIDWYCELPKSFEIWLMKTPKLRSRRDLVVPNRVTVLPYTTLGEYLAMTDRVKFYVCTHYESYGYGTIDMLVRGTKVMACQHASNQWVNKEFDIYRFHNVWGLQEEILHNTESYLDLAAKARAKCTSYDQVAKIIAEKLTLSREHSR